jgi:hypothetical protein
MESFTKHQQDADEQYKKYEEERWQKDRELEEQRRSEDREHDIRMLGRMFQGGSYNSYNSEQYEFDY